MSHDDDRMDELHRLALITRLMDDPGTVSDFEDLLDEDEAAALRKSPNLSAARRPNRKAIRS